jgi:tRNA-Thr(GGU) m(6)t(6)A37 methyltransferase TsaA
MENLNVTGTLDLRPIGIIQSTLKNLDACPLQETEGAPEAYIEFHNSCIDGIKDIQSGDKIIILTWLHLANREIITCYRRNDVGSKEFGVFSTRSPDRPNPIGLHMATVTEIVNGRKLKVFPMEVLDGTPVIDIKPYI